MMFFFSERYMGVSKNRGTPKWMVYKGKNPIKMGWFGGFSPYFWFNTHINLQSKISVRIFFSRSNCTPGFSQPSIGWCEAPSARESVLLGCQLFRGVGPEPIVINGVITYRNGLINRVTGVSEITLLIGVMTIYIYNYGLGPTLVGVTCCKPQNLGQIKNISSYHVHFHWFSISHRIHGTGIFTYIYHKHQPNVGKYTIHGSYGYGKVKQHVDSRRSSNVKPFLSTTKCLSTPSFNKTILPVLP